MQGQQVETLHLGQSNKYNISLQNYLTHEQITILKISCWNKSAAHSIRFIIDLH